MIVCIFEDHTVAWLEPLTLTRPAFDLRCGAGTLLERQLRAIGVDDALAWVRPELAPLCQMNHPHLTVNEALPATEPVLLINARWLAPAAPLTDLANPRLGIVDNQVAYAVLPAGCAAHVEPESIDDALEGLRNELPICPAGGSMITHLWELIEQNAGVLCQDLAAFRASAGAALPATDVKVMGTADRFVVADGAVVEPHVAVDTRHGPVLIDRGAVLQAFSRIEGPCYVGQGSVVAGAKMARSTLGPSCRVGGEVQDSIVQGFSNKYHDGFLGHSYLGEWVNIAAGTQFSDLRNDYAPVHVTLGGQRLPTGRAKIGSFVGDHTKTGLGTLLNTGSVIGAFCNLLPSGTYLPSVIPSFCEARRGILRERTDLRTTFQTAATVMRRRGFELTDAHINFYFELYDQTADARRKLLHENELRLLRQSV